MLLCLQVVDSLLFKQKKVLFDVDDNKSLLGWNRKAHTG